MVSGPSHVATVIIHTFRLRRRTFGLSIRPFCKLRLRRRVGGIGRGCEEVDMVGRVRFLRGLLPEFAFFSLLT